MNVLIIQARLGSSRLPGKVLKKINGMSLLELQYLRISGSGLADKIVIATTDHASDDAIKDFCNEKSIACFRGSEQDVLDRYYQAATIHSASTVIRITSDCPLHHHTVVDFAISEFKKSGADYFSNSNHEPFYLEDGIDVEVFTMSALSTAWKNAKLRSEREHVTPYIKNSGLFKCQWKKSNDKYHFKLSVDTADDLEMVTTIFNKLGSRIDFSIEEVVELLQNEPEILEINRKSVINAGYKKSLNEDQQS